MKAIILASGIGSRLGPQHKEHKGLIKIGNETLLDRILTALLTNKITDIVVTTGYKEARVKNHIQKKSEYDQLKIRYIRNPRFRETNYIYSMWLARAYLKNDDVLYVHADMVFDYSLFNKVVKKKTSSVIVDKNTPPVAKDLKVTIEKGRVIYIGLTPPAGQIFLTFSILKLVKRDMKIWLDEIDRFVSAEITDCYAENAFNEVSRKMNVKPLFYDKELGMDIDNKDDLEKARTILQKK